MTETHSHEWQYVDSKVTGYDPERDVVEGESTFRCSCGETMTHHVTTIGMAPVTTLELKVVLQVRGTDATIDRPNLGTELCDLLATHSRVAEANFPLLDNYPSPFRYKDSSNG